MRVALTASLNQLWTRLPVLPSLRVSRIASKLGTWDGLASSVVSLSTHAGWRQPEWRPSPGASHAVWRSASEYPVPASLMVVTQVGGRHVALWLWVM
ncbi:MAG TPA: hypothetical protein VFY45_10975 [Baekduia sp.]|nr:hypothetical protein [Baekduia sp.]